MTKKHEDETITSRATRRGNYLIPQLFPETLRFRPKEREKAAVSGSTENRKRSGPKGGRPAGSSKAGSRRSRAEAAGLPESTVQKLDEHARAVADFPLLEHFEKSTAIKTAAQLRLLPAAEHAEIAVVLERPDVDVAAAVRIATNLPTLSPDRRADLYKAVKSPDGETARSALSVLSALPPDPEPAGLMASEITKDLKRWRDRLLVIGENDIASEVEAWRVRAAEINELLKGRRIQV